MQNEKKVVLGISGGVDSAVSAYLLKQKGYEVIPVFLQVFDCENSDFSLRDATEVCEYLSLPIVVADVRKEFNRTIVEPFVDFYLSGVTPNPCVYCNYLIKWKILADHADLYGAKYIATGHYSDIVLLENGRYSIKRGIDHKDQSYVMYHLSQEILSRVIFALSGYDKIGIRKLADKIGLPIADKKDSQEICFVSEDYSGFIEEHSDKKTIGNFVLKDGTILGTHKGIHRYTTGQRKGLGIAYKHPLFVLGIAENGRDIIVGENESLFHDRLVVSNVNYMGISKLEKEGMRVEASIRYGHRGAYALIRELKDGRIECVFEKAQRAITKGQAAVFYHDDHIVAGGIIE